MMVRELDLYMKTQGESKTGNSVATCKMKTHMDDYFGQLKKEVGIDNNFGFEEDLPKLEDVKQKIKGNTNPKNFKEFWKQSDNIHKSMENRKISRKLHRQEEEAMYRQTATAK